MITLKVENTKGDDVSRAKIGTRNDNINRTICSCEIIGSTLDHMSNDKQSRNNLIRIAARRVAVCRCGIAQRAGRYSVTGELFKRTSAVRQEAEGGR